MAPEHRTTYTTAVLIFRLFKVNNMNVQYLIQCNETKEFFSGFNFGDRPPLCIPVLFGAKEFSCKDDAFKFISDNQNKLKNFSVVARYSKTSVCIVNESIEFLPHQERLILEQSELQEKLDALGKFLSNGKPENIDSDEWLLLSHQQQHMKKYNKVLISRIEKFKK